MATHSYSGPSPLCTIVHRTVKSYGNIRHCARSAFRPPVVGIRPLVGSFHWSAFRRSAFGHTPTQNIPNEIKLFFV